MQQFYVIGSINMDIISTVGHFPLPGETIIGSNLLTLPGGKGANQAVALARLNAQVSMFGKIGKDQYGNMYKDIFAQEHIESSHIQEHDTEPTGIALIEVEEATSQNRIVVIPGANNTVDSEYIDYACSIILQHAQKNTTVPHFILLQLEIPIDSISLALETLKQQDNIICILDPAPVPEDKHFSATFYSNIDYITPNETEIQQLTGIRVTAHKDAEHAGKKLIDLGVKNVIIKFGKNGAFHIDAHRSIYVPQKNTFSAIDTTAAGDSFNAGFAYALSQSMSIQTSIEFANTVAGLSTTTMGAQKSMPTLAQIEAVAGSSIP